MFCSNCGSNLTNNDSFCSKCGIKTQAASQGTILTQQSKGFQMLIIGICVLGTLIVGFSYIFSKYSPESKRQMAITYREAALPLMLQTGTLSTNIQNTMLGFANGSVYQHEAISALRNAQPQCAAISSQVMKVKAEYSELKNAHQYFIKGITSFCQGINEFKQGMELTNPQDLKGGSATMRMATQDMKTYGEEINRLQLDLNSK
jgi:hypothetical protein